MLWNIVLLATPSVSKPKKSDAFRAYLCAFDSIFVRIFECLTDLLELQLDLALRFNADWQALDISRCRWR